MAKYWLQNARLFHGCPLSPLTVKAPGPQLCSLWKQFLFCVQPSQDMPRDLSQSLKLRWSSVIHPTMPMQCYRGNNVSCDCRPLLDKEITDTVKILLEALKSVSPYSSHHLHEKVVISFLRRKKRKVVLCDSWTRIIIRTTKDREQFLERGRFVNTAKLFTLFYGKTISIQCNPQWEWRLL